MKSDPQHPVLLADGLNIFIRSFAADPMTDMNGNHVGGTIGFLRSLKVVMRESNPSRVIVVWDGKGGSQRRRGIFAEYKAGRKPHVNREFESGTVEESEENLKTQYVKVRKCLEQLGINQVDVESVEADDVIAFISKHILSDEYKVIVSSDKDMLQLVDARTQVYSQTKKMYYSTDKMVEEYGVIPENFVYMKALMGDKSDNIKGIGGVGPKNTVKLFPFLAERESNTDEILEYARVHKAENKNYLSILDKHEVFKGNVELMQLSSPIISATSVRTIRQAIEQDSIDTNFMALKIGWSRDGIHVKDIDFFGVYNDYKMRRMRG